MAGSSYTQQLILELMVKSTDMQRGLKQVGSDTKAAQKELDSFKDSASKALSFVGSVGVGAGIVVGLKKTVSAYGEFVNQTATATQVFGDSMHVIEEAMGNAVEEFGLSNTEFLKSTTYIAGLGKAAGLTGDQLASFSLDMTKLGADLAAAFNTSVPDAIAAIQSGFSGSSIEPLRQYNVVINDIALKNEYFALTGEKVTQVLSQQQRAAAFVSLLYKQTADFQGQWNRESDQFNGTMQRLTATMQNAAISIGASFEPAVTAAANAMIPLVKGVAAANTALGGFPVMIGLGTAALIAMQGPLAALEAGFARLAAQKSADFIGPQLSRSAEAGRKLQVGLAGLGTTTIAATGLMTAFAVSTALAAKRNQELNQALKDLKTGTATEQIAGLKTMLEEMRRTADTSTDWSEVWKGTIKVTRDMSAEFEKLADGQPEVAAAMLLTAQNSKSAEELFASYGITIDTMAAAVSNAKEENKDYAAAQEQINALLDGTPEVIERSEKAWDNLSKALGDVPDIAKDAQDALNDLIDSTLSQFSQTGDIEVAILNIGQAINDWADSLHRPSEEGETMFDRQIEQAQTYAGMFDAIGSAMDTALLDAERFSGHELIGQEKIDFLTGFLTSLQEKYPILAEQIQGMIDQLTGTKIDVAIDAVTESAQAKIDELFANTDAREVSIDMLVDAGAAPEQAAAIVDRLGSENVIKIITEAVTDAAEDDITILSDEERTTDVAVNALLDAAQDDLEGYTSPNVPYSAEVAINADLLQAVSDINKMRQEAAKPIYVRVIPVAGPALGPPNPNNPAGGTLGVGALMSPTQQSSSAVVPYGKGYAVTAGQPIVHNTRITVNVPTADPSAIVRSLQKWTRSNGSLPITRGRG